VWQMHNYSLYSSEALDYRTIRVFPQYLFWLCSLEIRRYGERLAFVLDQVGGALSCAAVLRVGLWPTAPPLCRYAKCATGLILETWRALHRCRPTQFDALCPVPLCPIPSYLPTVFHIDPKILTTCFRQMLIRLQTHHAGTLHCPLISQHDQCKKQLVQVLRTGGAAG
jgi:hypothetical protein